MRTSFPLLPLSGFVLLALAASTAGAWAADALSGQVQDGVATHYRDDGNGACLFGPAAGERLTVAINRSGFAGSAACGAWLEVAGPRGTVTVQVNNVCPECGPGHLDLSEQAFARIAPLQAGKVPIRWRLVSPEMNGPVAYHFKQGSNPWWTAVQVRNHRNPVARLEVRLADGRWQSLARTDYNYFVQTNPGLGPGPYTFRVSDRFGQALVDEGIGHRESGAVAGRGQFPAKPGG